MPQAIGFEVSIRYIAVLGFQRIPVWIHERRCCPVSIRYIAVLGFQQVVMTTITRNKKVSIRYIAVLGFQHARCYVWSILVVTVSIRYIAVLGFQHSRSWMNISKQ